MIDDLRDLRDRRALATEDTRHLCGVKVERVHELLRGEAGFESVLSAGLVMIKAPFTYISCHGEHTLHPRHGPELVLVLLDALEHLADKLLVVDRPSPQRSDQLDRPRE